MSLPPSPPRAGSWLRDWHRREPWGRPSGDFPGSATQAGGPRLHHTKAPPTAHLLLRARPCPQPLAPQPGGDGWRSCVGGPGVAGTEWEGGRETGPKAPRGGCMAVGPSAGPYPAPGTSGAAAPQRCPAGPTGAPHLPSPGERGLTRPTALRRQTLAAAPPAAGSPSPCLRGSRAGRRALSAPDGAPRASRARGQTAAKRAPADARRPVQALARAARALPVGGSGRLAQLLGTSGHGRFLGRDSTNRRMPKAQRAGDAAPSPPPPRPGSPRPPPCRLPGAAARGAGRRRLLHKGPHRAPRGAPASSSPALGRTGDRPALAPTALLASTGARARCQLPLHADESVNRDTIRADN